MVLWETLFHACSCGQDFDREAITGHAQQCRSSRMQQAVHLPETGRSAFPESPAELLQPLPTDPVAIDAFNAKMASIFSGAGHGEESMKECEHCSRAFREAALMQHQRLCTAEKPMKRVARQQARSTPRQPPYPSAEAAHAAASDTESIQAGTGVCSKCGQTFAISALARHEVVCATAFSAANKDADTNAHSMADAADVHARPGSEEASDAGDERVKCTECGRSFSAAVLARHERICRTVSKRKCKPLDTGAQRLAGELLSCRT
jgi:hypothetical protein